MPIEKPTTLSGRKIVGTGCSLARTKTTRKAAIRAIPLLACLLASCSPAGNSTQQVILEPTEPGATEVFEEPTETSTREPTATPTPTQEPTPTATQELQPMYQGPLGDMAENFAMGLPSIREFINIPGIEYNWFDVNLSNMTLVSERPVVIGEEPEDWGRENTVFEDIWGFSLDGEEYLFRMYRIGAQVSPPIPVNGAVSFLYPMGMFPNLEPGVNYDFHLIGFNSEIPEEYFDALNLRGTRYVIMPNARPILENMQIGQQQALLDFLKKGETGDFPVDENGIVDLRQVVLPYITFERE